MYPYNFLVADIRRVLWGALKGSEVPSVLAWELLNYPVPGMEWEIQINWKAERTKL